MSSEANRKAVKKYNHDKVDMITVRVPKGEKAKIIALAKRNGESVNGFINRAIDETMSRDNVIKEAVSE